MAATEDLLSARHPGSRPLRSVRSTGERPWRSRTTAAELADVVARLVARHDEGSLAVIAPPVHRDRLAVALPATVPPDLTEPVVLLTPGEAKGVEFDSVLIVDPAAVMAAGPLGHNDLYVAMTRATRRLGVVHPGPCPAELARIPVCPGEGNTHP
ncbi:ATP-binding domain-containing protein [Amycolatopsis sp. QT-25]|uniref:ATP-binding domain-containing protein n=1 Tax=Amycolatopsis sp. QT-25 TaxID=3034022 RepID=UPI003209035B